MELNREMTNEEAIEWLVAIEEKYIHGGDEGFDNQRRTALHLARNALALIKQLSEENEWLETALVEQSAENVMLCGENERLKQTITQLGENNDEIARVYPLAIKEAKADTVREMQERIKTRCIKSGIYPAIVARAIDQVAKEMTEEEQ